MALLALLGALASVHPAGLGFRDVRLGGVLGGLLGYVSWSALTVGTVAAIAVAVVVGALLSRRRGADREMPVPFEPFLLIGALVALLFAGVIVQAWVRSTGHA